VSVDGLTLGTPIGMLVRNQDHRSNVREGGREGGRGRGEILLGVSVDGLMLGTPIGMLVRNQDRRSNVRRERGREGGREGGRVSVDGLGLGALLACWFGIRTIARM